MRPFRTILQLSTNNQISFCSRWKSRVGRNLNYMLRFLVVTEKQIFLSVGGPALHFLASPPTSCHLCHISTCSQCPLVLLFAAFSVMCTSLHPSVRAYASRFVLSHGLLPWRYPGRRCSSFPNLNMAVEGFEHSPTLQREFTEGSGRIRRLS